MQRLAHISKDMRTQTLNEHLAGTAELAAEFAEEIGEGGCSEFLGKIHDIGKADVLWQNYLKKSSGYDESIPEDECDKGTHTSAGAAYLLKNLPKPVNLLLAAIVAGHHAGLPDYYNGDSGESMLKRFFRDGGKLKAELLDAGAEYATRQIPAKASPQTFDLFDDEHIHMLVRYLFSCLVDADWLDTERFMKPDVFAARCGRASLAELKDRFDSYMKEKRRSSSDSSVNRIRNKILESCIKAGELSPGFFSLTVPTGGGKTLSSLAFALVHALSHAKRRIIIAEPYTSIIEQTSKILKYGTDDDEKIKELKERGECLFGEENVLEHHSSVDPDKELYANQLATQNWDAPIIVTTNVQLFESLLSAKPSRCRKLHNIADSVIILDEAQKIPTPHLRAVLSALKGLVKHFGVTVLLCTATQPALNGEIGAGQEVIDGIDGCREIIPNTDALNEELKRVRYSIYKDDINYRASWEEIAQELNKERQALCIVNKRRDCRELANLTTDAIQLSGFMCGEEISALIAEIKEKLRSGESVRVVSTQLIEAGVDIDFPVVWRALAQLDSIAQAAGRSNREGRLDYGRVVVFNPDSEPFGEIKTGAQTTRTFVSSKPGLFDMLSPRWFEKYFKKFFSDSGKLDVSEYDNLLVNEAHAGRIQFRTFSERFKLIDTSGQKTLFVQYDQRGCELIQQLKSDGPNRRIMASLQRYAVNVPLNLFSEIGKAGGIEEAFGYYVLDKSFYKPGEGVVTGAFSYDDNNFIY